MIHVAIKKVTLLGGLFIYSYFFHVCVLVWHFF